MENQPTTLDKAVKVSIIVGVLIMALSIAYYLVIFMPQKEKARVEQQKQEQLAQLEKEKQQKEDKFRTECINEKKQAQIQYKQALDDCTTDKCTESANRLLKVDNDNYIANCLDRKLKGLPTMGY